MIIKTICDKRKLSYQYYIENAMHMVERRLSFIISRKPHLINALDRGVSHPLNRKCFHIPFNS